MYFGLSFSRVGADFRGLLAPIFERAALAGFTTAVNDANTRFMLILVLDDRHLFNGLFFQDNLGMLAPERLNQSGF